MIALFKTQWGKTWHYILRQQSSCGNYYRLIALCGRYDFMGQVQQKSVEYIDGLSLCKNCKKVLERNSPE
jgi:hypothetical protein